MRRFVIIIEPPVGGSIEEVFEMPDDATEDEISAEAADIFGNYCSYGYHEVEDTEQP